MTVITETSAPSRNPTPSLGVNTVTWAACLNGNTGNPVEWPFGSDRSVQIIGTIGAGFHCKIEGSNDGTNWATLNDTFGNALDMTALGIKQVNEITRYIRPNITGGDGTTSVSVILLLKGHR